MVTLILIGWLGLGGTWVAQVGEPDSKRAALSRYEYAETHMGSSFKLVLYSTDESTARVASRAAFHRIAELDAILSDYQPESELSRLSAKAGGAAVPVSRDLFEILERSKSLWEKSEGVFDITMAPVGRLWRRARRERKLPDPTLLAEAKSLVGSNHLVLDQTKKTARLELPGMKLDAGGIAKGYASQAALEVLRSHGIRRALVAGAGDIVVGDPPPDALGWTVGIAPLSDPNATPERSLKLANAAVSTSGDAERFVVVDGKRYSHIVDPRTGLGVIDRASITLVAPDGATADSLTTAVYVLGPEKGLKLVEATPGAAAYYVREGAKGVETFVSSRMKTLLDQK